MDSDNSGSVTPYEVQEFVDDPRSARWLQMLEIDAYDVSRLFQLLDDGDGAITIDEWMDGVARLKGGAKSIDLITVLHENKRLSQNVLALGEAVEKIGSDVRQLVEAGAILQHYHYQVKTM